MIQMRLGDLDVLEKFITDGLNNPDKAKAFGHDAVTILGEIYAMPTVDAVPVVRCRDCGWKRVCKFRGIHGDDGFCPRGVRKDGDG